MLFDGSVQLADKRSCLHRALGSIGSVQNVPFVATPNSLRRSPKMYLWVLVTVDVASLGGGRCDRVKPRARGFFGHVDKLV